MNKILRVLNSRLANIILPLGDFLFIYQLEEYNNRFFLSWVRPRFYKRGLQKVGRLQWTLKARTLYFLSLGLLLGCCLAVAVIEPYFNKLLAFFLIFFVFTFFTPLFLVLSSFLVYPLENRMKSKQIKAARSKLISMKELVIIAVAGSVGKTSTRHYLSEILKSKYKTFTPKGNYNTLLGISEEVLNMPTDTQALVVELGEFFPGDLMELAGLVKPKILVLTKTADQHIEKFGNAEAIDHEFVSLTSFPTLSAVYLSAENRIAPQLKGKGKVQTVNTKTWSQYFAKIKSFSLPRAESVYENLALAMAVAQDLGVGRAAARDVLISLSAVERRLLVSSINGITVIDDSYNISFESAKNAFEYARSLAGRKVLITGGIVEQGRQSDVVNEAFGELIAKNFEVAVIAKNQFYKAIDRGIKKANSKTQIFFSQSPSKTPLLLSTIIKTGDVVLVQNELPETYWH